MLNIAEETQMKIISDMVQLELNTLEKLFWLNNFKLISKQDNFRNITEEYNDEHINKKIIFKNIFSNREYIFENDKFNIYFKYNNTNFTTEKRYIMIVRIFDNVINMTNLCIFDFDDLDKELIKIGDFLTSTQVFIKSYKNLIGDKNESSNNSSNKTSK